MVLLHLPDGTDFDALGDRLARPRLHPPARRDRGAGRAARTSSPGSGPTLTPELQYVALDADDGLVLASDTAGYLDQALGDVADGGGGPPTSCARWPRRPASRCPRRSTTATYTCSRLAMAQADAADQAQARAAAARGRQGQPGHRLRDVGPARRRRAGRAGVRERRPGPHERRHPRPARRRAGAGPGRRASPTGSASARSPPGGATSSLDLVPTEGAYVLSDLSTGPVLFATC